VSEGAGEGEGAGAGEPPRHRLDPDRAARRTGEGPPLDPALGGAAGTPGEPPVERIPPPVINTRPYRIAIGLFGLALVVAFSVYEFTSKHGRSPIAVIGHRLHYFSAPLALSNLSGDANLNPPCTVTHHDHRALNVCLLAQRAPLVLAFFVTGSGSCEREVSTLQAVAGEVPRGQVSFAAVAVGDSHGATRSAVRKHGWTIPVAYDADGAVGASYAVEVCPMLVLARRGGTVSEVLIGKHWLSRGALAGRVRTLLQG
jgi:AhpC/TSA family